MAVSDYSTTAASNTSISGVDISGATGKVKDGDNAIRQIMADIKAGVPYLSGSVYMVESTDAGATAGPDFATYRNSATPAASDLIGRYLFQGEDSAGNIETYAAIAGRISDPTSTSEDAALLVQAALAGTLTTYVYVGANAAGTATANAVGLPLGQLSFPATQNASSDANTLDDYEEGTWTPAVNFGGATTGITYTTQSGSYTKIGRLVYFATALTMSSKGSATGAATITGLPFTSIATFQGSVTGNYQNMTSATGLVGLVSVSSTTITLHVPAATGLGSCADTNFNNTSVLNLSGVYQTS